MDAFQKLTSICKHVLIFGILGPLILILSGKTADAIPVIFSTSGTLTHGQSLVIFGSGFGSKTPVAPWRWDNFESYPLNSALVADCGYDNGGKEEHDTVYIKADRPYTGSKSARMDYEVGATGQAMFPKVAVNLPANNLEVYLSYQGYWTRYAGTGSGRLPIFKLSRGGSLPYYSGNPRFYETIRPASSGNIIQVDRGYVTSAGTTWIQTINSQQTGDAWWNGEYYYKLSNPAGASNGAFQAWVNSVNNVNATGVVTRLSSEANKFLDYVMTPFDGMDSYPSTDGYYFWVDDLYIDTTQSRVEICQGSSWNSRGHCDIQIPTAWNEDGRNVTISINQGAFSPNQTAYLYVVDSTGTANTSGFEVLFGASSTTPKLEAPKNLRITY